VAGNQDLNRFILNVQKIKKDIPDPLSLGVKPNTNLPNLYYDVGQYISLNTRSGKWGTGTMEIIQEQLQGEITGLSG
jgi:hypothetical protein